MRTLDTIALILLVVGGLNWGLVGLFGFNLVSFLFGAGTFLANLVYIIIAICALYLIFAMPTAHRHEHPTH